MLLVLMSEFLLTFVLYPPILHPLLRGSDIGRFSFFDSVLKPYDYTYTQWFVLGTGWETSSGVITLQVM